MMGVVFLVLFGLLIFVTILFLLNWKKKTAKYLKNIPGPKPIFPIGNTLDFIAGPTIFLKMIMNYLNKYGETIIIHDGAFSRVLCTIDYDFLEYLYSSNEHLDKAHQYDYFCNWLGEGLITSTGLKWRAERKALTPTFHFSILKDFITVFEIIGNKLIRKLQQEAARDSVEISKAISLFAQDVICESAMGVKINALENENSNYIRNIRTICNVSVRRAFSPVGDIFFPLTWNYFKEKKALKEIHSFIMEVINQKIEENKFYLNNNNSKETEIDENGVKKRLAFLDLLLNVKIDGQPLSKKELKDQVNTIMFAGHDTTASAISFCLLMLATNPQVQENVVKEQREIFNRNLKLAKPSYNQLTEMKYLELVIKETLRIFPSVPFFGRQLAKDIEFKGVLYPKGLVIILFPYGIQRSSKYFPEPEKFIPERFKDQSGKFPFSYTPFSAGPRNCLGQRFAMLEIMSIVSKVIRNFELGPAIPQHNVQLAAETILISKNGIRISIKDRTVKTIQINKS